MKLSHVVILSSALAFFACSSDDSSSPSSNEDEVSFDCSVKNGVKVVYPAGGETFHIGDTIKVVYGTDIDFGGFGFKFRADENQMGQDLLDGSADAKYLDGKKCNEQIVVLDEDHDVSASDEAVIRVYPYNNQAKGANSGKFKVKK